MDLPYITAELPGTGGVLRRTEADFEVEEIPAYLPSGEGDHVYAWIEKRGVTTFQAVEQLARATGANPRDVGTAGLKDRHAVTRQWVSFPPPVTEDAVRTATVNGVSVLEVVRHRNKLKTGHLFGNRFTVCVRDTAPDAADRARAILDELASPPGSPNWFGEQRFGARGDNHVIGRALVKGERPPGPPPHGRMKRLFVSAYQSHLFNEYLRRRILDGLYRAELDGELTRRGRPSGPMFGHKMPLPAAGTEAEARERAIMEAAGIELDDFKRVGKLALGTRREIAIPLEDAVVEALPDGIRVRFALPSGAYATAVLRELVKTPYPPPEPSAETS